MESRNYQTRKTVLEYDDVMNTQREVIYKQRRQVLDGEDLKSSMEAMIRTVIAAAVNGHMGEQHHMDAETFHQAIASFRGVFLRKDELMLTDEELQGKSAEDLTALLEEARLRRLCGPRKRRWAPPSCASWSAS